MDFFFTSKPDFNFSPVQNRDWRGYLRRRGILKNIVFNEIEKIREIKKKPKLKEVLAAFSKYANDPKGKNFIIDKLHALYSNSKNIQIQ